MPRPFDPNHLLGAPLMANLATQSPQGPRNAPMWFLWEDEALWMPSSANASSAKRLATAPDAAVEIVEFQPQHGTLLHLGLRGPAQVEPMDIPRFTRLLAKYLGPDPTTWNPWFMDQIARPDDPEGRLIRLAPTSIFTNNSSYFLTGPELAWPKE
ncbi:MAG: pyridoxamine 5'-phosphate oxidase family protein [Pseudomonadota bacterium]